MKMFLRAALLLMVATGSSSVSADQKALLPTPENVRAFSRQWRVDLYWNEGDLWRADKSLGYEVQRSETPDGPFLSIGKPHVAIPAFSDFFGRESGKHFYRVRMVKFRGGEVGQGTVSAVSEWSPIVSGTPQPLDESGLLTEVQEAGFRYFWDMGHPESGLARESLPGWNRNLCAVGGSGMAFFNIVTGIERGFIYREAGARRVLKAVDFLLNKAERFHGAYPHWIDGQTGKAIQFEPKNDAADILETSFLAMGLLLAREYFDGDDPQEKELREKANTIWESIEWDWFGRKRDDGTSVIYWCWSPRYKWEMDLQCQGFNECQMLYLLSLASPTHSLPDEYYWEGWQPKGFAKKYTKHGVELDLALAYRISLFPAHYSYMGLDPKQIAHQGKPYSEILKNWCLAQYRYVETRKEDFVGYDSALWGITASLNKYGYSAHAPDHDDNGTMAPTASLSSMPYLPEESKAALLEMFTEHGKKLWGPFGFYDSFNLTQEWFANGYIAIDVGPIGPMIENYRSGACWQYFMRVPELRQTIERLMRTEPVEGR